MDQTTVDPVEELSCARPGFLREEALIEVLFYPDFDRIGEVVPLIDGDAVVLGREGPAFGPAGGDRARPLSDPCLSRRQATVWYDARLGYFHVDCANDARRPVQVLRRTGEALPPGKVPPGTLLRLGDRALLLLDVRPVDRPPRAPRLHGDSGPLRVLLSHARALAQMQDLILVLGEIGVGKELVARTIHLASPQARGPFIAVNCAALAPAHTELELFGHAAGFDGDSGERPGLFRTATGGTLFFDEIGELPLSVQPKLLRALQERAVRPLGSSCEEPVSLRVLAATNRDLKTDVEAGRFRPDLLARLEGVLLQVPPLRERWTDIPSLLIYFLREQEVAFPSVRGLFRPCDRRPPPLPLSFFLDLLGRDWPGNVRELARFTAAFVARWALQGHEAHRRDEG